MQETIMEELEKSYEESRQERGPSLAALYMSHADAMIDERLTDLLEGTDLPASNPNHPPADFESDEDTDAAET